MNAPLIGDAYTGYFDNSPPVEVQSANSDSQATPLANAGSEIDLLKALLREAAEYVWMYDDEPDSAAMALHARIEEALK